MFHTRAFKVLVWRLSSTTSSKVDKGRELVCVDALATLLRAVPSRAGGHFLIWTKRVCAAQQGMVFRVLNLKQGIQFHYLAS